MEHHATSLGGALWTFTAVALALLGLMVAGFLGLALALLARSRGRPKLKPAAALVSLPALITSAVVAGAYLYAPQGLGLTADSLVVLRHLDPVSIPLADIRHVRRGNPDQLGSLRLYGVGGLFGSYGLYHSSVLGQYRLYATDTQNAVIVRTEQTTFVVTPDQPARFMAALRRRQER